MNSTVQRVTRYLATLVKSRVCKVLLTVFSLVMLTLLAAYLALPSVLKTKIPQLIQQQTGRKAALAGVELSLSPLALHLDNFKILETDNKPFVSFEQFSIQINVVDSIKQSTLILDSVLLSKPFVYIAKQKDGSFNFSHLLKPQKQSTPKNEDAPLFPLNITQIELKAGQLLYTDSHINQSITPIDLSINNFSTISDSHFDLGFSLAIENLGHIHWQGAMGINPLSSKGHIQLDEFSLEKIAALIDLENAKGNTNIKGVVQFVMDYDVRYAKNKLQFTAHDVSLAVQNFNYNNQFKGAELIHKTNLQLDYNQQAWQFSATKASIQSRDTQVQLSPNASVKLPQITLDAAYWGQYAQDILQLNVKQARLNSKNTQLLDSEQSNPLIKIAEFIVQDLALDLANKKLSIESVTANNASVQAWLDKTGLLNYQRLFASNTNDKSPAPETDTPSSNPWQFQLNTLALKNCSVLFTDKSLASPVSFNFKPLALSIDNISNQDAAIMPVQFVSSINNNSELSIQGTSSIKPVMAQVNVALKSFNLENLRPYVEKFASIELLGGKFSSEGKLFIAQQTEGTSIKFNGNSSINEFLTRDTQLHKDLIKWDALTLSDINIDVLEKRYTAAALVLRNPYAKVNISENKKLNLAEIIINNTAKTDVKTQPVSASTPPPANTKPLFFNLANIQLIDGASDFSDLSLIMPFYAQIKRLNGGASGISSEQKSTIKAALAGNAYDLAPVTIQADMNPHSNNYAITLKFDGMPMPLMSPYMVQFAGYKVENGKLFLELNYQIADKKLTASNKILIDQFELGDKVDNPKAVSLPLELAVALLKDANGKINLNVPITGSLDDPHFDIAQVLTNAVVNTMGQLITSPFRLLASLVDSDADISNIGFNAGNYKLEPAELSKLDSLAKALKARPKLHLTIKGVSFQNQDWPIIQHDALYDQLKIIHAAEIKQQEKREIRPEYVQISDLDYQRLLTQLFTEKFPLLAKQTLALKDSSDIKSVQKYYATAEQKLAEILSPEQERLKNLAVNRAQSIANYLVKQGGIDNARVFILDTKIQPNSNAELFSILALK